MPGSNAVIAENSLWWKCGHLLFSRDHFKKAEVPLIYEQIRSVAEDMSREKDYGCFLVNIKGKEFYVYISSGPVRYIELPRSCCIQPIRTDSQVDILYFHLFKY